MPDEQEPEDGDTPDVKVIFVVEDDVEIGEVIPTTIQEGSGRRSLLSNYLSLQVLVMREDDHEANYRNCRAR